MKFKHLVVASMSALGLVLVTGPAFAADAAAPAATATTADTSTAAAPVKHVHHRHHRHHHAVHHAMAADQMAMPAEAHPDYKGMGAMQAPVVEACTANTKFDGELSIINQQTNRAWAANCGKVVAIAGGLRVDGKWGNRSQHFVGTNVEAIAVNDAYLNFSGKVSDWATVYGSLEYGDPSWTDVSDYGYAGYSKAYTHNGDNKVTLEQIYGRIANFDAAPVYAQVGKQFIDHGRYETHAPVRSMTQVLTETLRTAAQVGFITPAGTGTLHGDVSAFNGPLAPRSNSAGAGGNNSHDTIYGLAIGYDMPSTNDAVGFNANLSYISDMSGVNDVEQAIRNFRGDASRHSRVGEIAADAALTSGPFSVGVDYAKALTSFDINDLATINNGGASFSKAEPWAAGINAGFGFNSMGKDQKVTIGYQESNEAAAILLPEHRWIATYNVAAFKNVDLGLQINRDTAYSVSKGQDGESHFGVGLSAGFQFGGANA